MKDCGVGGESHSGIGVLSVPAAPIVYMFAHKGSTNETPGLTPSATVRTANWLRHLRPPHRHVDDICSNSGEPLERQRQLTTPHHNQPVLPLRRLTRPLINNTRIDTPIATRPRTIISLARPPKCGSGLDWPTSEVGFGIGRQPPPCMTAGTCNKEDKR